MRLSFKFTTYTSILVIAATLSLFLTIVVDSSSASTKTGVNLPSPLGRPELKITFYDKWGEAGSEDGQFNNPMGIDLDSSGNVYVVDHYFPRVQKFASDTSFIKGWGSFCRISGGTDCVDPDGAGSLSLGDGQFAFPSDIAIDSDDNIYVADTSNSRIQKFTSDGTFLAKWGEYGTEEGQFKFPQGIAIDSDDNVYVADTENDRIQKFRSDTSFIREWGSYCDMWNGFNCVDPDGAGPLSLGDGQFNEPAGIAIDSDDNVYVADRDNYRIQKFRSYGTFIRTWGEQGTGEGELNFPNGIALDSFDDVYVVDTYNHRFQKFTNTGDYLTQKGQWGTDDGEFYRPYYIVIKDGPAKTAHRGDEIYVTDSENDRIQVFKWRLIGNP